MTENKELDVERTLISISILGESGVGKTQLTSVYIGLPFEHNDLATVGYDIKTKNFTLSNGKTIKVKIWDTAGQERFKNMASQYIKSSNGIIFVYDITDRASFEKINVWIKLAKSKINLNETPFVVIGNKKDLNQFRTVNFNEGEKFTKSINGTFYETSAKNGENVNEVFNVLINKIYELFKDEFNHINNSFNSINQKNNNFNLNEVKCKNNDGKCCGKNKK